MEPDNIYFYTASILNWEQVLEEEKCKQIIVDSFAFLSSENSVIVLGFVIMPNHIHLIWKPLKPNTQLRFMKFTAQKLKFHLADYNPDLLQRLIVNKKDRTYQIWQRNPLAVELYSPHIIEQKLDYVHNNPCQGKWKPANSPIDYKWSSASFYESDNASFSFLQHYRDFI